MISPRLSVVVPAYNAAAFVADAVDSVLAQPETGVELVVVDNGSTDDTPRVLDRFGDRIVRVHEPRRGLPRARNAGIERARGELLVFLDADDLHPEGYLAGFLAAAARAPEAEVFHCGWRGVDFAGNELYAQRAPFSLDDDPFHELTVIGAPHIGALMIRRGVLARSGMFDVSLPMQEDWDFWLRLAACGALFRGVPGNVLTVRRQPSSMSAIAEGRLALVGLDVLERQVARHPRCPRCPRADLGLAIWRRNAARRLAFDLARRSGLRGRATRWLTTLAVGLRRPRLMSAALAELAAGRTNRLADFRPPVE